LLEITKLDGSSSIGAEEISFRLAPRLNAPGRLGSAEPALELLIADSLDRARALAAELEQASAERRTQQERMLSEATDEITLEGYDRRPALVLGREGWNHGVVGIVAGRLADTYRRPVVVVGFERGVGRGSVRGPKGSRLHDALARSSDALVRFGGHQAAAGLELEFDNLARFRAAFEAACGALEPPSLAPEAEPPSVWLAPGDAPERVLRDFQSLEPCGPDNPRPELVLEARVVSAREVTGGHLKLELEHAKGRRIGAFGVELGARANTLGERVIVRGRLRPDTYRGGDAVELKLTAILRAAGSRS
jgi:single-stranded-DNA-specific exonuclease